MRPDATKMYRPGRFWPYRQPVEDRRWLFASPPRNVGMRILAFDGRMGASGDMILATLLDAGADRRPRARDRRPRRWSIGSTRRRRRGIAATTAGVLLTGEEESDGDGRDHDHHHDTDHHHDQGDSGHEHDHDGTRAEGHGPHRSYLESAGLSPEWTSSCRSNATRSRDLRTARRGGGERPRRGTRGDSLPRGGSRRRDRGRGRCHGLASRP